MRFVIKFLVKTDDPEPMLLYHLENINVIISLRKSKTSFRITGQ